MPTILTRGLGYDEPTIIKHEVASELVAHVEVESRLIGTVVVEAPPIARVAIAPIPLFGVVQISDALVGTVRSGQTILGVLKEEGPLMSLEVNKVTMFIRDDRTLSVTVNTDEGAAVDLTGSKIWFTVKARSTDTDLQALISKKNTAAGGDDSQVKITVGSQGKAEVYIIPADTTRLNPGTYLYDVQVTLANGKTYTVVRDKFTLKEDVTKAQV